MLLQPIHGRNFGCRIKSKFLSSLKMKISHLQNLAANYFSSVIGHSLPNSIHSCQPEHLTIPPSTIQWNTHHVEGIVLSQLQLFLYLFSKCSPPVSLYRVIYQVKFSNIFPSPKPSLISQAPSSMSSWHFGIIIYHFNLYVLCLHTSLTASEVRKSNENHTDV